MLVSRELTKGIVRETPAILSANIRPLLELLAYESMLIDRIWSSHSFSAKWAVNMLSDQLELKHALVREVLAYYSDRGAILIDVEVSAGAEQLYMFSHRLFQEYLAVEYLVGRLEPQDDVVAELAAFSRRSRSLSVWGLGLKAWAERRGVPADLVGRLRKVVKVGDEEEQTGGAVTGLIEAMRDEPDRRPVDDLLGWLRQMPANSYRAEMETVRAWRNGRRPGQA